MANLCFDEKPFGAPPNSAIGFLHDEEPDVQNSTCDVSRAFTTGQGLGPNPLPGVMCIRILVADSDEHQLNAFRQYFSCGAWFLSTAVSGLECMAKLREMQPHVLVLEPEILWGGGSGVLACMRADPIASQIPVIAVTKGRDRNELSRVLGFRLADFFIKPVRIDTIARRIHNVVGFSAHES